MFDSSLLRERLKNTDFAERVMRTLTGVTDGDLQEVVLFPEALMQSGVIAMLKGHDSHMNRDFVLGITEEWHFEPITPLALYLCSTYPPGEAPDLYITGLIDVDSDKPIIDPVLEFSDGSQEVKDGSVQSKDKSSIVVQKVCFINTRVDSEVMRVITGGVNHAES